MNFKDYQKFIAYWFIGTAFVILSVLSLGVYFDIRSVWVNFHWIEGTIVILLLIGWVIEMNRLGFFESIQKKPQLRE